MLGSHNSLSYLPIKGWKKISKPWTKCQNLTLEEQYEQGVRYFDLRVRKDKQGQWWYCHNSALFVPVMEHKEILEFLITKKANVRIILDVRKVPKDAENYKEDFLALVEWLTNNNLKIDSAIVYWEWYEYASCSIKQHEYHASVSAPWYKYILGTKWFANHYNQTILEEHKEVAKSNNEVLLIDYIR